MTRRFTPLPAQVDLPTVDREVLAFWRAERIFARSLEQTADGPLWVFYEGPPTANGTPGAHHMETRVFKDVFPRFKTMKGFQVPRKGGWDCHGLPVELAVEKELGFTGKQDIEAYGIAAFNDRCRESVLRHVGEFEALTERMGYWVDLSTAYRTMDPDYIESVWWSLKVIFDRGLLVQDHRVAPWCPRCGTGLSDHELAQGYEDVVDPSVYVRFPVTAGPLADLGASLLVWTTTPWTLVSNTAVAVHPDVSYVVARSGEGEVLVVAEPLAARTLGEGYQVLRTLPGRDLEHTPYARPFDGVDIPGAHYVGLAAYVTTEDGSGLVHQAPAFGADDLEVARRYGLPVVNPVHPDGTFDASVPLVGGMFFKEADPVLVADLAARGLLVRYEPYEHTYPHCWRCHTALIYYAQPSWYIRTTRIVAELVRENERTRWYPPSIQHGRYGDWLDNNVDWALSRSRYWGTPLPIWRCPAGHLTCVGGLAELGALAGRDLADLDPHRPFVDAVTFACPTGGCDNQAARVPEVIDCWYDSGAMPFAQWGYPHRNVETFRSRHPAQFICEAIDQTRGWFYTLMAVGTLVFDRSSYQTVLCLGHILDADGRKMSKHLGNVLEPLPLMDRHGADAVRWFLLAAGSPWQARRVSHEAIDEAVRKVLLTYWNTASFLTLYASVNGWDPVADPGPAVADRPVLDRWVLSQLQELVAGVDGALEDFDTQRAGRLLGRFVDELSNWYVRRSRRRFWEGDPAALATLAECLRVLTLLLAPFTPFVTERIWQDVVRVADPAAADSVHLAAWPTAREELRDPVLPDRMALARRLVELGRTARAAGAVKTRQPLGRALVAAAGWAEAPDDIRAQVADELNVSQVAALADAGDLVDVTVKPNFRALGRRFGKGTPAVAAAILAAEPTGLVAALRAGGAAQVDVDGSPVILDTGDLVVTETPREGWAVAADGGDTIALDLTVTPSLRRAGLLRDVVRLVQDARRTTGLQVSDRILLWWAAAGETAEALRAGGAELAAEVLAVEVSEVDAGPAGAQAHGDPDLGLTFWLRRAHG